MSMPTFQSTNPILQATYDRYFLKNNVLPPEGEKSDTDSSQAIMNKQKWKMLKKMPGAHSGNTWSMMNTLHKGLSPITKSAETKEARLGNLSKPLAIGGAVGVPAAGAAGYGAYKANDLSNQAKSTLGRVDDMTRQVGNAANQFGGLAGDLKNTVGEANKFVQGYQNAQRPWSDMLNSVGSGLAGIMGMSGYSSPQWYQAVINYLKQIFSGTQNKFTDPETGPGGVAPMQATASYSQEGEMMNLTNVEAITIALNGSPQFQKQASSGEEIVPDKVTKAHTCIAGEMDKIAGVLSSQQKTISHAHAFREAAERVRQGYPAKSAMFVSLGGSEKLAEKANNVLDGMGQDIIVREVEKTFQRKIAEWKEQQANGTSAANAGTLGRATVAAILEAFGGKTAP